MKVFTVLVLLSLSWVLPPKSLQYDSNSRPFVVFVVVEGLDVTSIYSQQRRRQRISSQKAISATSSMMVPRGRIGTGSRSGTVLLLSSPSPSGCRYGGICNIPLVSMTERQGRERILARVYNKQNDDDDDDDENDSDRTSDKSDDNNSGMGRADTVNETTATTKDTAPIPSTNRRQYDPLSDFLYGANYVHTQYLSILWRYSIVQSFALTLPIGIALCMDPKYGIYDALFRGLRSVHAISSAAARLLQLPLEFVQSFVLKIWNVSPEAMVAAIEFLPNGAAIPVVQFSLSVRAAVTAAVTIGRDNDAITFLSSMLAILVWRPAVEEWQYRSVLNKLLFGAPRWMLARARQLLPSSVALIQRFTLTSPNVTSDGDIGDDETSYSSESPPSSSVSMVEVVQLSNQSMIIGESNVNSTDIDVDRTKDYNVYNPFLPSESTRILLGSLLFATTRLGWLSTDPADPVGLSNSPYGFTIGFIQSILSLFLGGRETSEIRHGVRIFILLLAIHQTVSTFLVAQHFFAGIYLRRGLAASVGAHVSWTVGKGTIIFRLLWKFLQWSTASIRSVGWGSTSEVGDSDSNPSRGDTME